MTSPLRCSFANEAKCSTIDSGTRKTGINTIGSTVIRSLLGSTWMGWSAEGAVMKPAVTATTRSKMPNTFQAADEARRVARGARIGEAHHGCEKAHGDVAHTRRPGEQAGQLARGVKNEKDHTERAVQLHADQPLLRHGVQEAGHRVRSPNQKHPDQDRRHDTELDRRKGVTFHMVDAHRGEHDRQREPAEQHDGRDAERPRPLRRRPSRIGECAIESIEDGNDGRRGSGEDEIGQISGNGHDTPP